MNVYVERGCLSCERASAIAEEMNGAYPQLTVNIIDVSTTVERPAEVFAVPTFVIDGSVVSLGTPKRADLEQAIESAGMGGID